MPAPQPNFVRPDFSQYIVHFSKDQAPISIADEKDEAIKQIAGLSAYDRLISILAAKHLRATRMPWTNRPAICFTECTWSSLLYHARQYSGFGLGFTKAYIFSRGGGPAIYLTPGLMEHQRNHVGEGKKYPFDPQLYAFVTPFMPYYAPADYKERFWVGREPIDYSHEREWRVPHDLNFEYTDIEFVIINSYTDMAKAPKELKDAIGREKWLIMDNYATIESLWPVHKLPAGD